MRILNNRTPSGKERGQLTRIYGDEINWNGIATTECKKNRAKVLNSQRKATK